MPPPAVANVLLPGWRRRCCYRADRGYAATAACVLSYAMLPLHWRTLCCYYGYCADIRYATAATVLT
eukprot:3560561-Rhodomonas_salina.1